MQHRHSITSSATVPVEKPHGISKELPNAKSAASVSASHRRQNGGALASLYRSISQRRYHIRSS
jgi:hypothetical protein